MIFLSVLEKALADKCLYVPPDYAKNDDWKFRFQQREVCFKSLEVIHSDLLW